LYNLAQDLGETENLSAIYPEKTAELLGMLRTWRASLDAPVPDTKNPGYQP
jgi:hypothetical protein